MDGYFKVTDKYLELIDKRCDQLLREITKIKIQLDCFGSKTAKQTGQAILEVMSPTIKEELGIDIKDINSQIIIDDEGEFYYKGAEVECYSYVENGKAFLFQMKCHLNKEDIHFFVVKSRLFEKVKKVKPELYFIAITLNKEVIQLAKRVGVKIIGSTTEGSEIISSHRQ